MPFDPSDSRGQVVHPVTMVLMLPIATDNGARLAAILPTGLALLARGLGSDPQIALAASLGVDGDRAREQLEGALADLPPIRSFVMIVVDGLGSANLRAAAAYARTLSALAPRRIETVIPSTTGAALTTLVTGRLPAEHGLIGYAIRHPQLGIVNTLKGWGGITDPAAWQRATPLFELGSGLGARAVAIGRPAHATGGLTESILAGAEYLGGQTIDDRFAIASRLVRGPDPILAYLYIDELDRVAHSDGWRSMLWGRRLEDFDSALSAFLRTLPADTGVVVTADHGMIDIAPEQYAALPDAELTEVAAVGGEARNRSLYLRDPGSAREVADRLSGVLGKQAWVGTRDDAIRAGWFGGQLRPEIADRLGDVLLVARGTRAFIGEAETGIRAMVGQHGGVSDEERGVPVALAGALAGTPFAGRLASVARLGESGVSS